MGQDWMPPLEARELGAGAGAKTRSTLWRGLIAAAVAIVALVVAGRAITLAEGPRTDTAESVARAFVDARADGDAELACSLLTARAQRDMVALVRGLEPTRASAADCRQVVLRSSERSLFTDPELGRLRGTGLRTLNWPGAQGRSYAKVERTDEDGPFLELRKVRGEWKLDGLAAERVSYVAGCTAKGAPRRYCACTFDRLADQGHASQQEMMAMSRSAAAGSIPPVMQRAAAACGR